MYDDRGKRLYSPDEKIKKIMGELGPDMMEYFDDIRSTKKLRKKSKVKGNFSIGEIVSVNGSYGTVIYGPYNDGLIGISYEVEMEDGEILSVVDDGKSIEKYAHNLSEGPDDEDDF